jgi:AcrR family transcriptional regulator
MVDLWATVHAERVVFLGGSKRWPLASMLQEGPSLSSSSRGMIRRISPSLTSTCTGPPVVRFVSRRTSAIQIVLLYGAKSRPEIAPDLNYRSLVWLGFNVPCVSFFVKPRTVARGKKCLEFGRNVSMRGTLKGIVGKQQKETGVDTKPARRTQRMTAGARKRQIVGVALDLIAKHGLQGVTMSRIAAGAGIRQASLYTHFESREQILLAALDEIYQRIYASRMTVSDENTLERLREICDHHVELWSGQGEEHHAHLLLEFIAGAPGEGLRETLAAKHLETLTEFTQIVERGKKEGRIPSYVDSGQVAWFITGWAFAGDVSQAMGFKEFLNPKISGRWLDMMFKSFLEEPDGASTADRRGEPETKVDR